MQLAIHRTDQCKLFPMIVLLQYARVSCASHCPILGYFARIRTASIVQAAEHYLPRNRQDNRSNEPPQPKGKTTVSWYEYVACFFAGMFLANVVPHFVHGISGDSFPTPFAHPRGKGLSSPTVNVVWALFNLVVGYILFRAGKVASGDYSALVIFFAGIAVISTVLSVRFAKKQAK
jgi:hypothetical protein